MMPDERKVQRWKAALAATDKCLSLEELSRHAEGSTTGEAKSRASAHLSSCTRCQTELAMLQEFERAAPSPDETADVSFIEAELKRRLATSRPSPQLTRKIFAPRRISTAAMSLA